MHNNQPSFSPPAQAPHYRICVGDSEAGVLIPRSTTEVMLVMLNGYPDKWQQHNSSILLDSGVMFGRGDLMKEINSGRTFKLFGNGRVLIWIK